MFKNCYFEKSDASVGFKLIGTNTGRIRHENVRELHVYDLGDGMLVPCQLVDDLFG